jgi:low affinity Fe/Cu permease
MPRASNDPPPNVRDRFNHFARRIAESVGSVWAFLLALLTVLVWGLTGPLFGFSDTWQLVINTGTTIVTFIMVFLIQSTQNRDAKAMHLKLDELIRAVRGARNDLLDLEELPEKELQALAEQFAALQKRACAAAGQQREGKPRGPAPAQADYAREDRRPSSASSGK